jgi:hypothetical protein
MTCDFMAVAGKSTTANVVIFGVQITTEHGVLPAVQQGNAGAVLTSGTGTAQLSVTAGVAQCNAVQINSISTSPVITIGANVGSDPWATIIPGIYGAGTAGHRLGALPDVTAGVAGGVFIAGTNAATTITGSFTTTFTGNLTGSVASVTGAVGSVTGNVGGNVVGSTASVTGAVGSVTGNVGGSVASVTGAVGSVTGNVGGNVAGSVASVTAAVTVTLSQALSAPRALDAIADASLTLNDALHCAIAAAAGKESVVGTAYTIKTPSTGSVLRTFTLDSSTAPTTRT